MIGMHLEKISKMGLSVRGAEKPRPKHRAVPASRAKNAVYRFLPASIPSMGSSRGKNCENLSFSHFSHRRERRGADFLYINEA